MNGTVKRRVAAITGAFAAALFAAHYLLSYRWLLWSAVGLCAIGAALLAWRGFRWRALCLLLAFGAAAGLIWRWGYIQLTLEPLRQYDNTIHELVATVQEPPEDLQTYYNRVVVKALNTKIVLYLDSDEEILRLRAGDVIRVKAQCRVPMPGAEDTLASYRKQGITMTASQLSAPVFEYKDKVGLLHTLNRFSIDMRQKLYDTLPQSVSALAAGVFLGDVSTFTVKQADDVRLSGLAHITSVSGMHVTFLLGFLLLVFGNRRWAFVPAVLLMLVFVALTGFPASAIRAVLMQALMLLAYWRGKTGDTLSYLFVALAVLLAFNPYSAADVGLQLSFAATLGLILFGNRWNQALRRLLLRQPTMVKPDETGSWLQKLLKRLRQKLVNTIISGFATAFASLVFSTLLLVYYFGYVSLLAPIATLLVLAPVTLLFLLTPLYLLLHILWAPLGAAVGALMWILSQWFWLCADMLVSVPYSVVPVKEFYAVVWIVSLFAILTVVLLARNKRKLLLPAAALILLLLAANYTFSALSRDRYQAMIAVVDVGQGQAIVVQSRGQTLLIDCGSLNTNAGSRTVSYLRSKSVVDIDAAILTHGHTDHANGMAYVDELLPIYEVFYPINDDEAQAVASSLSTLSHEVGEIMQLGIGTCRVTVYPPIGDEGINENCLAIVVECNGFSLLITGDMDLETERKLGGYYQLSDMEMLIAGHHGSKYATGEYLLTQCAPQAAVISVGKNSFGHPTQETLERLNQHGVAVYRTDELGDVIIGIA